VVQVNPLLTTIDGVPALSAVATLSPATASPVGSVNRLLPGMNAAVEIIAGSAEDALLIPVEALRELGPAQYAVFVMVEGEPQMRVVEVGLMDFSYAEIISGLAQGDVVTTGIVETE
jgi:multidrug efflux pump subunit AcrA (membrane-fusion protein)